MSLVPRLTLALLLFALVSGFTIYISPRTTVRKAINVFYRGNAYYLKGEFDKAIADYTEAIRLDPKYALAYSNRGYAYYCAHPR